MKLFLFVQLLASLLLVALARNFDEHQSRMDTGVTRWGSQPQMGKTMVGKVHVTSDVLVMVQHRAVKVQMENASSTADTKAINGGLETSVKIIDKRLHEASRLLCALLMNILIILMILTGVGYEIWPGLRCVVLGSDSRPQIFAASAGAPLYKFLLPLSVSLEVFQILSAKISLFVFQDVLGAGVNVFTGMLVSSWSSTYYNVLRFSLLIGILSCKIISLFAELWAVYRIGYPRSLKNSDKDNLLHVIVIPCYKEPLSVLRPSLDSVAAQVEHIGRNNLVVVIALESRDPLCDQTFATLEQEYSKYCKLFLKSIHTLKSDEIPGAGSNVYAAIRLLATRLREEDKAIDMFKVLVTKMDADTSLDPRYCEQLAWAFLHQLDGRRFIYHAPIVRVRNIAECSPWVHDFAIRRSCTQIVNMTSNWKPSDSCLSVTLGFCEEQGSWWPPDEMSEDFIQSFKASLVNGEFGVKNVWCANISEHPHNYRDLWKQAIRHNWGHTLVAWSCTTTFHSGIDFPGAFAPLSMTMYGLFFPPSPLLALVMLPEVINIFLSLDQTARVFIICSAAFSLILSHMDAIRIEQLMWFVALKRHSSLQRPSLSDCAIRGLVGPVALALASFIYYYLGKYGALWHAFRNPRLYFERSPKGTQDERNAQVEDRQEAHFKDAFEKYEDATNSSKSLSHIGHKDCMMPACTARSDN